MKRTTYETSPEGCCARLDPPRGRTAVLSRAMSGRPSRQQLAQPLVALTLGCREDRHVGEHADAVAVRARRVVHRLQREQAAEGAAVGAAVGQLELFKLAQLDEVGQAGRGQLRAAWGKKIFA